VRKTNERFEVRIVMINLLSRLIGAHRLQLPAFYAYLQRYLQPHQRDITLLLAYLVQACHEQVLPDTLQPLLRHLANHFVTDKSRPEMVAIGLNTAREVCVRVPLAMDETLLADLIEYRRDRDRAVVAGARSLLQLFRTKAPALLHKKYRGKGCDVDAEVEAYGAVKVATGVDGAELLSAREARLAAKGMLAERDDEKEWKEGGLKEEGEEEGEESAVEVDSDMSGDELEGGSGEGSEEEDQEQEEEQEEEGADGKAGDGDEEGGESSEDKGEDAGGSEEDEEEEEEDAAEEVDALEMAGRMRAATPPVRVDVSRILTPADFDRIRRLKQMQEQAAAQRGMSRGQKRRLAEAGDSDNEDGPVGALALEGEAVDPMDIAGAQARKAATREQKLASTLAGREDRQQFGRRKKVKSGGTSNVEKKKTKDFRMMTKSRDVQRKVQRREEMARKARRSQKKMFRGKVRK
jgi:protein SDA1